MTQARLLTCFSITMLRKLLMTRKIFSPHTLGDLKLTNRIAMAPMTRSRTSQPGDVPNETMATYYSQRANAGLIVSEGTPISAVGRGYSMTPGIYTQAHIDGWRKTTDAVHAAGSSIFVQLWHVGRRSHSVISGSTPVAASAVKDPDKVFGPTPEGTFDMIETEQPREMTLADIQATIADYVRAARNAIAAGFDGVEIHAAHGYLLDGFLRLASNQREDQYGGSQDNRMRFPLEVLTAVSEAIGANRVAVRLSPYVIEGFADPDPEIVEVTLKLLEKLAPMRLAYVHFSEHISRYETVPENFRIEARARYPHPIMVAGKLTLESAENLLAKGYVDMVAFGTPYVTNPDLAQRVKTGWPLAEFDADARLTLYGGGVEGYCDYPPYTPPMAASEEAKPELAN
jgi:N-ethylmaleimide reductase